MSCRSTADSLAVRGGSAPDRRLAVRARGRRRDGRGRRDPRRRGLAVSLGVGHEARDRGRGARRGRGGDRRSRRACRAARLDASATCSPMRPASRSTPGAPIARPGTRRIYSNYGFEVAAALVAERAEMPFAEYFAATWAGTAIAARGLRRLGGVGDGRRSRSSLPASCRRRGGSRPRRSPRRRRCSSPASSGCCPGSDGRTRTTGGSASSCATASHPTGRARATRRATFGHFGRSGTFLWVDPEAGLALGCLTDLAFGDWAADAWPRLSDAVVLRTGQIERPSRASPRFTPPGTRASSAFSSSGWSSPTRWPAPSTTASSASGISSARCWAIARKSLLSLSPTITSVGSRSDESGGEARARSPRAPRARSATRARGAAAGAPRPGARGRPRTRDSPRSPHRDRLPRSPPPLRAK